MNARDRQVAELRAQAADLKVRGYAAMDAGDGKLAQELLDRAILRDEIADGLEAGQGEALLRSRDQSVTTKSMVSAARAHISAGKSSKSPENMKLLVEMANDARHTLRSLAEAAAKETGKPCPHNIVTRALHGSRRIRLSAARVIQRLTKSKAHPGGFEASAENWPGGWASED